MKLLLNSIVELIVQACDPDEILLFGSYAKENGHSHSDVDILVIGDFHRKNRLLGWELRGLLDRFAVPIDVHIATRDEIMCAQHASSFSFLKSIFSNASSLYKKAYDIHGITMECRRDVQNVQKKSLQ